MKISHNFYYLFEIFRGGTGVMLIAASVSYLYSTLIVVYFREDMDTANDSDENTFKILVGKMKVDHTGYA